MKRKVGPQPVPKKTRPINPRFKSRLPGIMTEICDKLLVIEPASDQMNEQLREFLDYLDFEIRKVKLEVKAMKWEDKVDLVALREAEDWLQQLQQLKTEFNVDVMSSPPRTIRAMVRPHSKAVRNMKCSGEVPDLTATSQR
jgi:hypothetical protein